MVKIYVMYLFRQLMIISFLLIIRKLNMKKCWKMRNRNVTKKQKRCVVFFAEIATIFSSFRLSEVVEERPMDHKLNLALILNLIIGYYGVMSWFSFLMTGSIVCRTFFANINFIVKGDQLLLFIISCLFNFR